jgi:hypothetical protein
MFDPDSIVLLLLAVVVLAILLVPPGPGSPLPSPVKNR